MGPGSPPARQVPPDPFGQAASFSLLLSYSVHSPRWREMEQVLPEDAVELQWEEDPILEAVELAAAGEVFFAEDLLGDLLTVDLRCLDGYGIYLWRRGDLAAAADVFRRLLWLNPHDNTGARFNLAAVEAGDAWETASASDHRLSSSS